MWTPNNPNYYLKHSFEKEYSDYGVPYIDEDCVMGESNNYVIYGHHMKNETMFHDLCNYASKDFYDEQHINTMLLYRDQKARYRSYFSSHKADVGYECHHAE